MQYVCRFIISGKKNVNKAHTNQNNSAQKAWNGQWHTKTEKRNWNKVGYYLQQSQPH